MRRWSTRWLCALSYLMAFGVTAHAKRAPVIVIDPGHGGSNAGAHGPGIQRHEKWLTLALAKATARCLAETMPQARVLLTRYTDRYVTLSSRVQRANQAQGDVFVSIHFNASESRAQRGVETYVLSARASDKEAERVARAERRSHRSGNRPDHDAPATIMTELAQHGAHMRSTKLATSVQRALAAARPKSPNRGVRHAPFDVLMGLRMPGVLVEAGFIDHAQEGPELIIPEVQQSIAKALAAGIADYLQAVTTVARR